MDAAEVNLKLKCLELAASVARRDGDTSENSIVNIATTFYNYVNGETSAAPAKRGPKPKAERQAI